MKKYKLISFCATAMALCLFTGCASSVDSNDSSSGNSSVENADKEVSDEPAVEPNHVIEEVVQPDSAIDQDITSFEDLEAYTTAEQFNINMALGIYALAVQLQEELDELYPENMTLTWHTKDGDEDSHKFSLDFDSVILDTEDIQASEVLENTELASSIAMFESWTGNEVFLSEWAKVDDFILIFGVNSDGEAVPYTTSAHWSQLGIPMSVEDAVEGVMAEKMEDYQSFSTSETNQNDVILAYELVKSARKVLDSLETVPEGVKLVWQGSQSPYLKVEGDDEAFLEGIATLVAETPAPTTDFALETPLTLAIAVDEAGEPYFYCVSEAWAETLNMPSA